jgi:hypothetical protein
MCVSMMRSEMSFSVENLIAIRTRILSLLFVVALFMDLPVVFSGKTLVASSTVISLLDLELALPLPSAWFWHGSCAVSRSLVRW